MAQLRYRLRPTVPANGNAHDQRGAECPLRLHGPVGEGIRLALSNTGLIQDDPDDAGIKCLPHWLVEGLLSRVARLGAPAVGKIWAVTSISVAALSRIEDALVALAFDFSPCSLGALMQRLDSFVAPTDGPHGASFVVAAGADLFAHAALPPADSPAAGRPRPAAPADPQLASPAADKASAPAARVAFATLAAEIEGGAAGAAGAGARAVRLRSRSKLVRSVQIASMSAGLPGLAVGTVERSTSPSSDARVPARSAMAASSSMVGGAGWFIMLTVSVLS